MIAVFAVLMDSYRSLKAQKLFKTVLILSMLVIIGFASFGFDDQGVFLFFGAMQIENEYFKAGTELASTLYMGIFSAFIVNLWLGWVATILALISTSSIYPQFLSAGSVELVMSKPVRRTTMFIAKYMGGLLFVILQVSLFCIGAFLVTGWRLGEWNPTIFYAIPLITIFYSYLFCINTFIGVWTRSTLVALLFTMLFWFGTFGIRTADDLLNGFQIQAETMVATQSQTLESNQKELVKFKEELVGLEEDGSESGRDYYRAQIKRMENAVQEDQELLEGRELALDQLRPWSTALTIIRWPLPETQRTIGLLQRWVEQGKSVTMTDIMTGAFMDEEEAEESSASNRERRGDGRRSGRSERRERRRDAESKMVERENEISAASIIGWSLLFEFVVLVLAWWIFIRRDY